MIRFEQVSFSYREGETLLSDADGLFPPGLTLILGPNGCGKSTLLKLAAGVEHPHSGRITIDGKNLWKEEVRARSRLVYLPEHPDISPYASLLEVLTLVCRLRDEPVGRAREALAFFGIDQLSSRTVRELSLGQRRQAVFAAALIGTPGQILLDEPFESMDRLIKDRILDWLNGHLRAGAVAAVATHAFERLAPMAGQALTISGGKVIGSGPLPRHQGQRLELLEKLAAGEAG